MVQYFVIYLFLLSNMIFAAEQLPEVFLDFSYPKVGRVYDFPYEKENSSEYCMDDVIDEVLKYKNQLISISFSGNKGIGLQGIKLFSEVCQQNKVRLNLVDLSNSGVLVTRDDFEGLEKVLLPIANYVDITGAFLLNYQFDEKDYNYISEEELVKIKNLVFIEEENLQSRWTSAKIYDRFDELPLLKWHKQYYTLKKALLNLSSSSQQQMEEEKNLTQEKTFQQEDKTFPQSPKKNSFNESTRSNSSDGDKK